MMSITYHRVDDCHAYKMNLNLLQSYNIHVYTMTAKDNNLTNPTQKLVSE